MRDDSAAPGARPATRAAIVVSGVVQGVGFRPFVYALARELGLAGAVRNTAAGVEIEIEGPPGRAERFRRPAAHPTPRRSR